MPRKKETPQTDTAPSISEDAILAKVNASDSLSDPNTGTLSLSSIRHFVLQEDAEERQLLQKTDAFLREELHGTDHGTERRLTALFYAIVTKTRLFSLETPEMRRLFRSFVDEMEEQIVTVTHGQIADDVSKGIRQRGMFGYLRTAFENVELRLRLLENRVHINQVRAFLYLCEYYVHFLERTYKNLSMSERVMELYVVRMDIRRHHLFFERKFGGWFGMALFRSISTYGTSFGRLAITCFLSVALFASVYWMADFFAPSNARMIADLTDYSSYFFNSLVTISGLGIDASPQTALQRFAMGVNTLYGMVVFGMLFNVISTKLSMNN